MLELGHIAMKKLLRKIDLNHRSLPDDGSFLGKLQLLQPDNCNSICDTFKSNIINAVSPETSECLQPPKCDSEPYLVGTGFRKDLLLVTTNMVPQSSIVYATYFVLEQICKRVSFASFRYVFLVTFTLTNYRDDFTDDSNP